MLSVSHLSDVVKRKILTPEGLEEIYNLLNTISAYSSLITGENLCERIVVGTETVSIFHYLASNALKGLAILEALLVDNKTIAKGITPEALYTPALHHERASAFFWLAGNPAWGGVRILETLFSLNPGLIQTMTIDHLYEVVLPKGVGKLARFSPLYYLTYFVEGHDVLRKIFSINPTLKSKITGEILCAQLPYTAHPLHAYRSILDNLIGSSSGQEILLELLEFNPALATTITRAALCKEAAKQEVLGDRPVLPVNHEIPSLAPIALLAKGGELGHRLARVFLRAQHGLRVKLLANAGEELFEHLPSLMSGINRIEIIMAAEDVRSLLYYQNAYRREVLDAGWCLQKLVNAMPSLFPSITLDDLSKCGFPELRRGVTWLILSGELGHKLLEDLVERYPSLRLEIMSVASDHRMLSILVKEMPNLFDDKTLTHEELYQIVPGTLGMDAGGHSIYSCLKRTAEGRELLKASGIPEPSFEAVASDVSRYPLSFKEREVVEALSNGKNIRFKPTAFLEEANKLLSENPTLSLRVTGSNLCQIQNTYVGYESLSVLYYLAEKGPEGIAILEKLLKNNPDIAKEMTPQTLYTPASHERASAFFRFAGNPNWGGHRILKTFFSVNPVLIEAMIIGDLCAVLPPSAGDLAPFSPLYYLALLPSGHEVLKQIFSINPTLKNKITGEILSAPLPETARAGFGGSSILHYLSSNSSGREILLDLLAARPELASEISAKALEKEARIYTFSGSEELVFFSSPKGTLLRDGDKTSRQLAEIFRLEVIVAEDAESAPVSAGAGAEPESAALVAVGAFAAATLLAPVSGLREGVDYAYESKDYDYKVGAAST